MIRTYTGFLFWVSCTPQTEKEETGCFSSEKEHLYTTSYVPFKLSWTVEKKPSLPTTHSPPNHHHHNVGRFHKSGMWYSHFDTHPDKLSDVTRIPAVLYPVSFGIAQLDLVVRIHFVPIILFILLIP